MPQPHHAPHPAKSEYIYGIDLVRFACAVSVTAFHLTWMTPGIAWFLPFGWVGVQVFFVISGLVIANSAQGATPRQFMTGRFLRIYPTAWCAAAISWPLFLWAGYAKGGYGLEPLYFSVILFPGPYLATAYWTLPIELAFYFVVYTLITFHGFKHIRVLAIFLILWGTPYLIALGLNSRGLVRWGWVDFQYLWANMSLLRYGPYFGLGILVWLFKDKRLGKLGVGAAGLALAAAILEIYAKTVEVLPKFAGSPLAPETPWNHLATPGVVAFFIAFAAILVSVKLNHRFPANPALRKTVRLLGLTTYPLYLLHERVGEFFILQFKRLGLADLSAALVALVCTGLVSFAIAWYFEPRLRGLLKKAGGVLSSGVKKPVFETT
jgi:peptidoglycan/LPS O-acetylase OafA/YrhL